MSSIKIKTDYVKSQSASSLPSSSAKVSNIGHGVGSVASGIDGRILARRNISGRLATARNSIQKIENEIQRLNTFINQSMDSYSSAESKIASKASSLSKMESKLFGITPGMLAAYRTLDRLANIHGGPAGYQEGFYGNSSSQGSVSDPGDKRASQGGQNGSQTSNKDRWKGQNYLIGDQGKASADGITASGGVGYYEYDWVGISGYKNHGQIGGEAKFSGINGQVEFDTDVIDTKTNVDILTAGGTTCVGGKGLFPLAKAEGKVLGFEGRSGFDQDIPLIGNFGAGGKADILTANAFAGVDTNKVGIGAQASLAEAEGDLYIPLPFTDYDLKLIGGVSAGSVGAGVEVGLETTLEASFLIGVKIGIGIEKDD
ncbi:hypothetical protein [Neobacillus bataviensis]|uniref:hypothetical protein n=1 Tax=Neobacillus bataviensis TaxID=220685 RepID=UPI001CBF987F|nr:hypothetical protein [Neobacillus bataviensis]